jgi:serine/threonine protein kinase
MFGEIAAGGMATVHLGRLLGPVGFSRTVAIKRLHPQYAKDPDFVSMFLDEARVAARIQHPNVVPTLDVVSLEGELFLVMDYVAGESLGRLLRALRDRGPRVPPRIVGSIMTNVLYGLHAAHEARSERGEPLGLIHRDVSPQNVLVGLDGVARVLDFGVAKAAGRVQTTGDGQVKGKLSYMPPEQIAGGEIDRRADIYAASVVLWEALTGRRLFDGPNDAAILQRALTEPVPPPSQLAGALPEGVDEVVLCGLARRADQRFQTAFDMAVALEERLGVETPRQVAAFVEQVAREPLSRRALMVQEIESRSSALPVVASSSEPTQVLHTHPTLMTPAPVPGDSSVSSISLAATHPPGPQRRSHALPIAIAVATLGLGAGALALVLVLQGGRDASTAGSERPASAAPAATSAAFAQDVPVVSAVPEPSAAPSASSVVAAASGSSSAAAKTAPLPQRPTKSGCNPPYVVVNGIRKLKPECL